MMHLLLTKSLLAVMASSFRTLRERIVITIGTAIAISSLMASAPASAEGRCPPGFFPTGGNDAGWLACAPMGPMEEAGGEEDMGTDHGSYASDLPPMRYNPKEWAAMMEIIREGEEAAEAERMNDPLYRELKAGFWDYGRPGPEGQTDVCLAVFLTRRGGVVMMDWQNDQGGTFLAFYGGRIPKAKTIETAIVTLNQSGADQTVNAFHAPFPWQADLGMIMFAVPSTSALVSSIEDRQDFAIKIGEETLVWGEWHSGLEARQHLADCISQR